MLVLVLLLVLELVLLVLLLLLMLRSGRKGGGGARRGRMPFMSYMAWLCVLVRAENVFSTLRWLNIERAKGEKKKRKKESYIAFFSSRELPCLFSFLIPL